MANDFFCYPIAHFLITRTGGREPPAESAGGSWREMRFGRFGREANRNQPMNSWKTVNTTMLTTMTSRAEKITALLRSLTSGISLRP